MNKKREVTELAEQSYDAIATAAQQSWEDRQLAEYRIESAYWDSVRVERAIVSAESVTLAHISDLKKMNRLDKKLKRMEKRLSREQVGWHELGS
jgi:hypothetical protein